MARNKKSGGFNKVLEFIGLVDDEDPRDTYKDEYESGNYGRAQTYAPQRTTRTQTRSRQDAPVRRTANTYEPTRTPRMSRTTTASSRFEQPSRSASTARRTSAYTERSEERSGRYDYTPRPASRFGSLENDNASLYNEENNFQRNSRNNTSGGARQRTVMFSLHALEDCCDVIDNLILNNTVVLTMDDLDAKLMQRAVDTLSGAVFALHATIRKASDRTYLIAPANVEVNETYDTDRDY